MTDTQTFSLLAGTLGAVLGGIAAHFVWSTFLAKKRFNRTNAIQLLLLDRPEEWNELRALNPDWVPDLRDAKLHRRTLPGVNMRRANLTNSSLRDTNLEGADFTNSVLVGADLSNTSLIGASFQSANLKDARFEGARLDGTSFDFAESCPADVKEVASDRPRIDFVIEKEPLRINYEPYLLDRMNPHEFRFFVLSLFERAGYAYTIERKGQTSASDFVVRGLDPLGGRIVLYVVEVKKLSPSYLLGVSSLRTLLAEVKINNADRGVLVTTNELNTEARRFAKDNPEIHLMQREELLNWNMQVPVNPAKQQRSE